MWTRRNRRFAFVIDRLCSLCEGTGWKWITFKDRFGRIERAVSRCECVRQRPLRSRGPGGRGSPVARDYKSAAAGDRL